MRRLSDHNNIKAFESTKYQPFALLSRADIILTDSGGIQEEAPTLGKPVLVMRDTTERSEAVEAGTVKLVGTDVGKDGAVTVEQLLDDKKSYAKMSLAHNPYGDGHASQRICHEIIANGMKIGNVLDANGNINKVNILGLGYIGLPTAVMFASNGIDVVGVDINQNVVKTTNNGSTYGRAWSRGSCQQLCQRRET